MITSLTANRFIILCKWRIASGCSGDINDHRTWPHGFDHFFRNQYWCFCPGICAVVITISDLAILSAILACCFCINSSVCCTAYPPALLASAAPCTSTNFAPRLITSSFTSGLVSKTSTTAAQSPCSSNRLKSGHAGTEYQYFCRCDSSCCCHEHRKISSIKIRGSNTALYPAIFPWELNTSMDCARVVRGSMSREKCRQPCSCPLFHNIWEIHWMIYTNQEQPMLYAVYLRSPDD